MGEGCAERNESSGRGKGHWRSSRCSPRLLWLVRSLCAVLSPCSDASPSLSSFVYPPLYPRVLRTMPSNRSSTCFVPGCKGGCRSCSEKLSVFKAPKDLSRREQWARNIKRADKELTRDSVVCERHFDVSFIERTYRHVINGEVVEIPRDCPRLSEDAVPTVFPDAPKYFFSAHTYALLDKIFKQRQECPKGAPKTLEAEEGQVI